MESRRTRQLLIVLALMLALPVLFTPRDSSDLMALWMAGQAFSAGEPHLIYPAITEPFQMRPPVEWASRAEDLGHQEELYPYLYAPLWAALASHLQFLGADGFKAAATLINPVLLLASSVFAWRALKPRISLISFVALGQAILYGTYIGSVALLQNQLQILVAFLTIVALERSQAKSPLQSGAALALAAAIKLYPAVFVVFWIGTRRWSEVLWFTLSGAVLAACSILLAGWPLHQEFLSLLGSVSATAMGIALSFGVDSVAVDVFLGDVARVVHALVPEGAVSEVPSIGWLAVTKSEGWQLVSRVSLLVAAVGIASGLRIAMRGGGGLPRHVELYLWCVGMIAIGVLSPLAWAYYFIAPALLLPGLVEKGMPARGLLFLMVLLPISLPFNQILLLLGGHIAHLSLVGLVCMVAWAALFSWAVLATRANPASHAAEERGVSVA